ncbi:MAG TPA: hypothetical protein VHA75_08585, partial [Rugosimonospora sp.]|nr:hypothetical protein [Rugosimonospora sp.]
MGARGDGDGCGDGPDTGPATGADVDAEGCGDGERPPPEGTPDGLTVAGDALDRAGALVPPVPTGGFQAGGDAGTP